MDTISLKMLGFWFTLSALTTLCACSNSGAKVFDAGMTDVDAGVELPAQALTDLDVLFMIDNSGSMGVPQARLRRSFSALEAAIRSPEDVLPNLQARRDASLELTSNSRLDLKISFAYWGLTGAH